MQQIWRGVRRVALTRPKRVACNLCGWSGRHFFDDTWHVRISCPKCKSQLRHRLLWAALTHLDAFSSDRLVDKRRVLHFAPEAPLSLLLRRRTAAYVTTDYQRSDV